MKRLLFVLTLVTLAALAWPVLGQEPPPSFQQAVADLSARTGRALTQADFDNFAWAQDTYPDTAFGCPVPPSDVRPGPVSGYLITITLDGVTYDYRSSADGSLFFLCGQSGQSAPPGSTAAPPAPAATDCPTGYVGYLQPRLSVGMEARVGDGDFPNRLRSAATTSAQQIGLLNPGTTMAVIGGPACADTFVWWQVRAGDQTGWTAEGVPPDEYFLEPTGASAALPTAGEAVMPQFATVQDGAIALWTLDDSGLVSVGEIAAPPMTEAGSIAQLAFSPDGQTLALRVADNNGSEFATRLYVADAVAGAQPRLISDQLVTEMPVSFTPDGTLLYAVEGPADAALEATIPVQVVEQALTAGAAPMQLGEFPLGVGCGGGWSYPAVGALNAEAGYGGRPLLLAVTPAGLLHSTNCTGSGLSLLDLATGESQPVGDLNLSRAVVAPDGTQIAAIAQRLEVSDETNLTIIDLDTLATNLIPTALDPDRIAWTADGGLVYSSAEDTGDALPGTTGEPFVSIGFSAGIPARTVTVAALDPETSAESSLYTGPGYQVGRLLPLPGGDLLFSVIPAGEEWAAAMAANGIPADISAQSLFSTYFEPELLRQPADGSAQALGSGFQITVNPAALAAG